MATWLTVCHDAALMILLRLVAERFPSLGSRVW
jgi:hypothetical protein